MKPHFEDLTLENYRGFKHYRFTGFRAVNLLVGPNNCGKTSALEAVQILATGGDPDVLAEIASYRGEFGEWISDDFRKRSALPSIFGFATRRDSKFECRFKVAANVGSQTVEASFGESRTPPSPDVFSNRTVRIQRRTPSGHDYSRSILMQDSGAFDRRLSLHTYVSWEDESTGEIWDHPADAEIGAEHVRLFPGSSINLAKNWNQILKVRAEQYLCDRLRMIEPRIVDIAASARESHGGELTLSDFLVAADGVNERVPLGSYGEGLAQLFRVALSSVAARGCVLLVDEIDTGLYYQVLHKMWEMVIRDALKHGTQVFATTHSLDCLRGLDAACRLHPELAEHISVQKMVPGIDESIPIHAEALADAIKIGAEIR